MNVIALDSVAGPDPWTFPMIALLGFMALFIGIILHGIWKRSLFTIVIGLFFGFGFWFKSPYATEMQRSVLITTVIAAGLLLGWLFRRQRGRLVGVIFSALLLLLVLYLTSPVVNFYFFERFVAKASSFVLVTAFTSLLLFWVLPRVPPIAERLRALFWLICAASFAMWVTALSWWLTAVEVNQVFKYPVIRTEAELIAEYERTKSFPTDFGVFVIGTAQHWKAEAAIPTPEDPNDRSIRDEIAFFEYRDHSPMRTRSNIGLHSWFPLEYNVTLSDGKNCRVSSIQGRKETWNWKKKKGMIIRRGLYHGDPVVAWGRPVKSVGMVDGVEHYGLQQTRLIASGSLETFQEGFLKPAVSTARLFGWAGFGCLFLAFIPPVWAWRHNRRVLQLAAETPE